MLAERLLAPVVRGRRRHPAARLHPLPVPGPHDRRRDGPRRRARVVGRRDRLRGAGHPRRRPGLGRRAGGQGRRTGSSRRATSAGSATLGRPAARPRARRRRRRGSGTERSRCSAASGSYPGPGGACSGYLVDDGDHPVWLDAGPGTLANLQRHVGLDDLDAIVLSHEHPDHWSDLEGWSQRAAATALERARASRCTRPPACASAPTTRASRAFDWHDGRRRRPGRRSATLALTFSRTDHPVETLAVRVDGGGRGARLLGRHRAGLVAGGARARPRPGPVRGDRPQATRRARCSTCSARQAGHDGAGGRRRPPRPHPPVARRSTRERSRAEGDGRVRRRRSRSPPPAPRYEV